MDWSVVVLHCNDGLRLQLERALAAGEVITVEKREDDSSSDDDDDERRDGV